MLAPTSDQMGLQPIFGAFCLSVLFIEKSKQFSDIASDIAALTLTLGVNEALHYGFF